MKAVCALAVGVLAVLVAGTGVAQDKKDDAKDYAKKIVGKWEITKAGNPMGAQAGSVLEYQKDGKLKATIKAGDRDFPITGTYKVDGDKVTNKFEVMGQEVEETLTITKLTDDALELKDKDGGVDVCKRVKDKDGKEKKEDKKD
jgi:uncharacterized protein (TIGR03066 family)